MSHRIEKDSMGEMKIPNEFLYGATTQRAVENFPVSDLRFSREFIEVLAALKSACALSNKELGRLDGKVADAIIDAASEVEQGKYDSHFVVDIFQTGSGTSTNMNFNEVASNIANQKLGSEIGAKSPVHPNDHINMGQSSNDIIPTAIHLAVAVTVHRNLLPNLEVLHQKLEEKAKAFKDLVKTGRTHLQDATPLTLGQEFSGYAEQMAKSIERVKSSTKACFELAIGGTAVGTGINTHPEFSAKVCSQLASKFNLPFVEAKNHFEAQAAKDACVELSGSLKTVAVSLTKIANDIRWLGCGPRCGFAEIILPEVQPGSSIMPGKVNPVIAESVLMVCGHVVGNDAAVSWGGAAGNFELNVMMPMLGHNLLESISLLSNASNMFALKCVEGIAANTTQLNDSMERSLMLATALAPAVGYDTAAQIAKTAYKENKNLKEVALKLTDLKSDEIDKLLDPSKMVTPS